MVIKWGADRAFVRQVTRLSLVLPAVVCGDTLGHEPEPVGDARPGVV